MSPLLPSECPNCGRMHDWDFGVEPGPVQRDLDLANACIDALEVALFGSLEGRSRDTLEARAAALADREQACGK